MQGVSALDRPSRQQATNTAATDLTTSHKTSPHPLPLLPAGNVRNMVSAPASSSQQQGKQPSDLAAARLPAASRLTSGEESEDYGAQLDLLLEEAESLTGALGASHAEHALPDTRRALSSAPTLPAAPAKKLGSTCMLNNMLLFACLFISRSQVSGHDSEHRLQARSRSFVVT